MKKNVSIDEETNIYKLLLAFNATKFVDWIFLIER